MSERDEVAYIHGDEGLGALAAGAFFDLDEDADGEPTIWLTKGAGDPLPMPVLSPSSLHPDVRHLWPIVARRILDGRMYFEGMEFKARAEAAEAKLAAIRALAENVTTYWWSDALDCWVVRREDVLDILGA